MSWLNYRAFVASALACAATALPSLQEGDWLSLIFTVVFGGIFWGAIITWAMKRWRL